ncbi:unnamed protein product [Darwinula stevensoni]|uniref:U8 snoRNA-decapping enzyme n=1 Tax=Darwinula stevensoni TaxID=69355 RepID=A0A7R9A517_9CRUS|nr:unnamed protein product [Darwinula stevensoni]CAG0893517.1 unnamed protein product [Darwinula stevensoni]
MAGDGATQVEHMSEEVKGESQDNTWGWLESTAHAADFCPTEDHAVVPHDTPMKEGYLLAAHCMIYALDDSVVFNLYCRRAAVLMHMRFDGYLGFPGGLVDTGEEIIPALNRELHEEMNLDLTRFQVKHEDHVISHENAKNRVICHFYALCVSLAEFEEIERAALASKEHGHEVLGHIRVPLYVMGDGYRGFPTFLDNNFCGNARSQLLTSLKQRNILPESIINAALAATKKYVPASS